MKLYSSNDNYKLYHGNMLDLTDVIPSNSVDSIVTDPPYELEFMNKGWDSSGIAFQVDTWKKCFNVLKPGGYLLAFGGSRTFHRIAVAIEDAGFEIRDTIMWLYGSGFPKSMNLGKSIEAKLTTGSANTQEFKNPNGTKVEKGNWGIAQNAFDYGARPSNYDEDGCLRTDKVDFTTEEAKQWGGWGTTLKPAYEPIIVARKPCIGSTTDNVLKYGVGGINIDECRIPISKDDIDMINAKSSKNPTDNYNRNENKKYGDYALNIATSANEQGRFPANLILTYDETDEQEVCGGFPNTKSNGGNTTMPDFRDVGHQSKESMGIDKLSFGQTSNVLRKSTEYVAPMDEGSASRYFYCAKASKRDRDEGLDNFKTQTKVFNGQSNTSSTDMKDVEQRFTTEGKNIHPTVKPTDLMQYLVRLVTPDGGTILDPFNGSGSTGKGAMWENRDRGKDYKYVGIELSEEYLAIAKARIEYVLGCNTPDLINITENIEVPKKEETDMCSTCKYQTEKGFACSWHSVYVERTLCA